jgi:hypothetical protein
LLGRRLPKKEFHGVARRYGVARRKKGFWERKRVFGEKKGSTEELGGTRYTEKKGFHEKFGGTGQDTEQIKTL